MFFDFKSALFCVWSYTLFLKGFGLSRYSHLLCLLGGRIDVDVRMCKDTLTKILDLTFTILRVSVIAVICSHRYQTCIFH